MAEKQKEKENKRSRNWRDDEVNLPAEVLADIDNGFAEALERLALKKAANDEVYEHNKTIP